MVHTIPSLALFGMPFTKTDGLTTRLLGGAHGTAMSDSPPLRGPIPFERDRTNRTRSGTRSLPGLASADAGATNLHTVGVGSNPDFAGLSVSAIGVWWPQDERHRRVLGSDWVDVKDVF